MWRTVCGVLDSHRTVWSSNAAFSNLCVELSESINAATAALQGQTGKSNGITTDRETETMDAITKVVAVGRIVKVFAMDTGNAELLAAVDYNRTVLVRQPKHELIARLRSMIDAVAPYQDALASYGLVTQSIDATRAAINLIEERLIDTRLAITGKKAVTDTIPAIMKAGQTALTKLDNLIHLFEAAFPEFVAAYKAARAIVHAGMRHNDAAKTA